MRKVVLVSLAALLCCGVIVASETPLTSISSSSTTTQSYSSLSIPTGAFFNGTDFVYVQSSWVRIVINGDRVEYDIRNAEKDPYGNYALVLSNGSSMTIYSDGCSLWYNGTTYTKK